MCTQSTIQYDLPGYALVHKFNLCLIVFPNMTSIYTQVHVINFHLIAIPCSYWVPHGTKTKQKGEKRRTSLKEILETGVFLKEICCTN